MPAPKRLELKKITEGKMRVGQKLGKRKKKKAKKWRESTRAGYPTARHFFPPFVGQKKRY
jgi:hypothetical protein